MITNVTPVLPSVRISYEENIKSANGAIERESRDC